MIVIDASAILEVLMRSSASGAIVGRIFRGGETWHAPHLLDLEVAQVLRRYVIAREIEAARGLTALEDLKDMPFTRYPHVPLLSRIWELRANFTAYDAAYLALAEALDCPLLTRDARLGSAPSGAVVEVV